MMRRRKSSASPNFSLSKILNSLRQASILKDRLPVTYQDIHRLLERVLRWQEIILSSSPTSTSSMATSFQVIEGPHYEQRMSRLEEMLAAVVVYCEQFLHIHFYRSLLCLPIRRMLLDEWIELNMALESLEKDFRSIHVFHEAGETFRRRGEDLEDADRTFQNCFMLTLTVFLPSLPQSLAEYEYRRLRDTFAPSSQVEACTSHPSYFSYLEYYEDLLHILHPSEEQLSHGEKLMLTETWLAMALELVQQYDQLYYHDGANNTNNNGERQQGGELIVHDNPRAVLSSSSPPFTTASRMQWNRVVCLIIVGVLLLILHLMSLFMETVSSQDCDGVLCAMSDNLAIAASQLALGE